MLVCPDCSTWRGTSVELVVHRNGKEMVTYCQDCGREERVIRDTVREKWPEEVREEKRHKQKISELLSPAAKKRLANQQR